MCMLDFPNFMLELWCEMQQAPVFFKGSRLRCSDSGDLFQQKKGETPFPPTNVSPTTATDFPGKTKKKHRGIFSDCLDAQSA